MNKYILFIDDNEALQEAFVWCMEDKGYSIIPVSNGQEALDLMEKNPLPMLIILDMMMPIMDGFTFREHQQRNDLLKQIPTIILSAQQKINIELHANETFFYKPFNFHDLYNKISDSCTIQEQQSQ
jgi:CheY-like chemotaxis protein